MRHYRRNWPRRSFSLVGGRDLEPERVALVTELVRRGRAERVRHLALGLPDEVQRRVGEVGSERLIARVGVAEIERRRVVAVEIERPDEYLLGGRRGLVIGPLSVNSTVRTSPRLPPGKSLGASKTAFTALSGKVAA